MKSPPLAAYAEDRRAGVVCLILEAGVLDFRCRYRLVDLGSPVTLNPKPETLNPKPYKQWTLRSPSGRIPVLGWV